MQCTSPDSEAARLSSAASIDSEQVVVTPSGLLASFATVPDPRRRQGTRFPLAAILALAVAAILSNHLSVLAIAEWGADQGRELLGALGFPGAVTPHQSTLQRLFRKLDPKHLSDALSRHLELTSSPDERPRGSQGVAIDGKAQRGRLAFDSSGCTVHALSAFLHDHGIILAQESIDPHPQAKEAADGDADAKQPIEKGEAELSVAPDLIKRIDWHGRVLTGDALFCQRNLCQLVVDSGGDYLFIVKENQPTLHEDIRLLFDPPPGTALPLDDRREARTVENGHGRHHDTRELVASTDLVGYTDWPHLAQTFRFERTWDEKGTTKREVRYGITSLPLSIADADRLLELKRGHWGIENSDHYVKDTVMGEDRSLVHLGDGPSILATLRDLALSLLHRAGHRAIASRLRYHSLHPDHAVALLVPKPTQNA
jgi:predicted transposase YbfD/YdcC